MKRKAQKKNTKNRKWIAFLQPKLNDKQNITTSILFSIFGVKRHCTVLHDGRIGIQNGAAGTGKFFGLLKFLHSLDL